MYIFKNALSNVKQNKGRNFLVGMIILILIISTTVSIVINNTTNGIINDYKNRFGSEVSINIDMNKLDFSSQETMMEFEIPNITPKQYVDFANSECLKSYSLTSTMSTIVQDSKVVDGDLKKEDTFGGMAGSVEEFEIVGDAGNSSDTIEGMPNANLISVSDFTTLNEFKDKTRQIVKGAIPKKSNECIISEELAEINNFKIGDTIKTKGMFKNDAVTQLTISGIYRDVTSEYGDFPFKDASINRRNEIITKFDIDNQSATSNMNIVASYILKSPDLLDKFRTEVQAKGLPDIYSVTTDEESYNRIVSPVVGLSGIASVSMWVILIIGCVILLIIQAIVIRERKYEIGVLRAMGMKKFKLAKMFVYESLIITAVCLIVGFGVGSVIAEPVADSMIKSQVEISQNNHNEMMFGDGGFFASEGVVLEGDSIKAGVEPLSNIDVAISLQTILQIILISMIIAVITSLVFVIVITKYEPMKILSERN